MTTIQFFAAGLPKGQPRPKAFHRKGMAGARVYDPGTAEGWKSQVAEGAKPFVGKEPFSGPLRLVLVFWFPRPKGHLRSGKHALEKRDSAPTFHVSKPDADNLAKAVMDALTVLRIWADDSQICRLVVEKKYAVSQPGCFITISEMTL